MGKYSSVFFLFLAFVIVFAITSNSFAEKV